MKHKLTAGVVVPYGRVTAHSERGEKVFLQGQYIAKGWTVTAVDPPEIAVKLGIATDKPASVKSEGEKK